MKKEWLKNARMYEVFPTSFYDSNGDGIGDLCGITEKLDYIAELGFNIIWLNPCFCSPFNDGGYDISDYYKIDERFGTNQDLIMLIEKADKLNIKILLDLVAGHTSDRHPFFIESCKAEKNKYSDFYIWTNNPWDDVPEISTIMGNAEREGRYGINFFVSQPALNHGFYKVTADWQFSYDSEQAKIVSDEIVNVIKFYLKLGISGFRVDMAHSLVKNDENSRGTIAVWQRILSKVKAKYPEAIFISEWGIPKYAIEAGFDADFLIHANSDAYNQLLRAEKGTNVFYGNGHSYLRSDGLGNVDNFFNYFFQNYNLINEKGYICVPSGNHDLPRISLLRDNEDLKLAFAFLYMLPNLPLIYYGDEIGMQYQKLISKDGGYMRTGSRTPMQWSNGLNAGFSENSDTYLPFMTDTEHNVEIQKKDINSLLNFVKTLNTLKIEKKALNTDSSFNIIEKGERGYPIVFERKSDVSTFICAFNPSKNSYVTTIDYTGKEIIKQNSEIINKKIRLNSRGFLILETKRHP